jgi:hypothetical protein
MKVGQAEGIVQIRMILWVVSGDPARERLGWLVLWSVTPIRVI